MYKVIMAPTKGGAEEQSAIGLAVRLAQRFDAFLRLVRVDTPQAVIEPLTSPGAFAESQLVLEEARICRLRKLEALGTECRALGEISVITALEEGPAGPTLRDYARKFHVDLIVMSSHCRGGFARIALGSVTDFLVRHADVPVLVVKQGKSLLSAPGEDVHRIVVPLDGSALAEQILPHVAALAGSLKATISLLQVLTPISYSQKAIMQPGLPWWDDDIAAANEYLDRAAAYLAREGVSVSKDLVLSDNISSAILDYATRSRADLVAVATSGVGGVERLLFGSVADEIVRKAPTSVLVLHPTPSPVRILPVPLTNSAQAVLV